MKIGPPRFAAIKFATGSRSTVNSIVRRFVPLELILLALHDRRQSLARHPALASLVQAIDLRARQREWLPRQSSLSPTRRKIDSFIHLTASPPVLSQEDSLLALPTRRPRPMCNGM